MKALLIAGLFVWAIVATGILAFRMYHASATFDPFAEIILRNESGQVVGFMEIEQGDFHIRIQNLKNGQSKNIFLNLILRKIMDVPSRSFWQTAQN